MDLVGTCPKGFWKEWLLEGDCAGDPRGNLQYCWQTRSIMARMIFPGDRFYVVAHGRLRGYALVTETPYDYLSGMYCIYRCGGAVAVTIPETVRGFRGLKAPWWDPKAEIPFPDWKTCGVDV